MPPKILRTRVPLVSTMPVTLGSTNYQECELYSITLAPRKPGSVHEFQAEWQISCHETYEIMLDGFICIYPYTPAANLPVSAVRGIDTYPPGMHYRFNEFAVVDDALLTAMALPLDLQQWYVCVIGLAASTSAKPGDVAIVDGGSLDPGPYGELVSKHWSP
jgi:hypothetical protein